ncbi:MAG: hypothetical protein MZV64_52575 [Ignavibacteriales bacterium]|nr:hypothetical protein [Ignavibacteriales bacterium]
MSPGEEVVRDKPDGSSMDSFFTEQAKAQTGGVVDEGRKQGYVEEAKQFSQAFASLARAMRYVPGWKNLILFSAGISQALISGQARGLDAPTMNANNPDAMMAELNAYDGAQSNTVVRTEFAAALEGAQDGQQPHLRHRLHHAHGRGGHQQSCGDVLRQPGGPGQGFAHAARRRVRRAVLRQHDGLQGRPGHGGGHHQLVLRPRLHRALRLGRRLPQDQGPGHPAGPQGLQPERLLQSQAVPGLQQLRAAASDDGPGPERESDHPDADRGAPGPDAGRRRRLAAPRRLRRDPQGDGGRGRREKVGRLLPDLRRGAGEIGRQELPDQGAGRRPQGFRGRLRHPDQGGPLLVPPHRPERGDGRRRPRFGLDQLRQSGGRRRVARPAASAQGRGRMDGSRRGARIDAVGALRLRPGQVRAAHRTACARPAEGPGGGPPLSGRAADGARLRRDRRAGGGQDRGPGHRA